MDLAAVGIFLSRTTPNTDGSDLVNMEAIQKSGPSRFNRILPLRIKGQIATIPAVDRQFPSVPGRTLAQQPRLPCSVPTRTCAGSRFPHPRTSGPSM